MRRARGLADLVGILVELDLADRAVAVVRRRGELHDVADLAGSRGRDERHGGGLVGGRAAGRLHVVDRAFQHEPRPGGHGAVGFGKARGEEVRAELGVVEAVERDRFAAASCLRVVGDAFVRVDRIVGEDLRLLRFRRRIDVAAVQLVIEAIHRNGGGRLRGVGIERHAFIGEARICREDLGLLRLVRRVEVPAGVQVIEAIDRSQGRLCCAGRESGDQRYDSDHGVAPLAGASRGLLCHGCLALHHRPRAWQMVVVMGLPLTGRCLRGPRPAGGSRRADYSSGNL